MPKNEFQLLKSRIDDDESGVQVDVFETREDAEKAMDLEAADNPEWRFYIHELTEH
jgi:hypothetical protein